MFAECLSFTNEYMSFGRRTTIERVLFPGTSCFPISPCPYKQTSDSDSDKENHKTKISQNDQLLKIMQYVCPTEE